MSERYMLATAVRQYQSETVGVGGKQWEVSKVVLELLLLFGAGRR